MTSTEHGACVATASETLPSNHRFTPRLPVRTNNHEVGAPGFGFIDDFFLRLAFDDISCRAQARV